MEESLVRNGLVWGALAVCFLLYRFRPASVKRQPERRLMGLVAGGVAAVAFEWMT